LDYHARVRIPFVHGLILGIGLLFSARLIAQDETPPKSDSRQYDETFSGPIVELSKEQLTVTRSILGKPPEKKVFLIKADTRVEGKLRLKAKVTVGFVKTDEGSVARLIVVRTPPNKK
jgi:hypothetical protein